MKRILLCLVPVFISAFAFAQTVTVSGTVNDLQGKPVPFVFIRDSQHSYATYTDQSGGYTLNVDPASRLVASATSFKDTAVAINNKTEINIVMAPGISVRTSGKPLTTNTSTDIFKPQTGPAVTRVSDYIRQEGDLHGSRFLSEKWMHGFGISYADSLIQNNSYFFNYDKTMSDVLFSRDQRAVFTADKQEVKAFTLIDDAFQTYSFEAVPAIDPKHYSMVLATGNKYKIYRLLTCKLVKANFTTNGITSSGNNYDEYVDENHYFIWNVKTKQLQPVELKSKSIKTALATDADKLKAFNKEHGDDDINEAYLKDLGDYLNK
ncbi:hypothetical protein SAMN05421821_11494 [Mucilaginibacter lappiensis]|uniref:CarboxypepD_reg-like domain-containing protein n=1 Tax=Mucilaginibacter lappiensis TaxID=354630 RepID=A0ABR6PU40_9SPHI|nr:carboxypeptidase-like regulatory domain-containing protein [Mucilaginibacter lappiensis]MBB6111811.1 hypothetical protein [Mucilaginibacter lappiensis]SIR88006.1 hypothetical protein SAMN05421821_11494 [Mucilaginibacter lappiensis]